MKFLIILIFSNQFNNILKLIEKSIINNMYFEKESLKSKSEVKL